MKLSSMFGRPDSLGFVTGVPIFDDAGEIQYVVACNRGVSTFKELRDNFVHFVEAVNNLQGAAGHVQMVPNSSGIVTPQMVGESPAIQRVYDLIENVRQTTATVLITGESGVGKSETAIELVKRGHRLIADDAVEIKRNVTDRLVGTAPELIRHYIELRGIGVIDVCRLFGMSAVKDEAEIDMVINLEQWKDGAMYDRLGLENLYTTILDVQVPSLTVPVRPGRNLAVIIEVAAMNNRHRRYGYNAAEELARRVDLRADMGSQATQEKQ